MLEPMSQSYLSGHSFNFDVDMNNISAQQLQPSKHFTLEDNYVRKDKRTNEQIFSTKDARESSQGIEQRNPLIRDHIFDNFRGKKKSKNQDERKSLSKRIMPKTKEVLEPVDVHRKRNGNHQLSQSIQMIKSEAGFQIIDPNEGNNFSKRIETQTTMS